MNVNDKRRRGRPVGSGLNDMPVLKQMADMMVRTLRLRATTALHRIEPDVNPATKRRIQMKWKQQGQQLLAEAEARLNERNRVEVPIRPNMDGGVAYARRAIDEALGMQVLRPIEAVSNLASAQAALLASSQARIFQRGWHAQDLHDSPVMRAMRTVRVLENSPLMRIARDLDNSAVMRAARGLDDGLVMRMARDFGSSAVMRAAQG